MSRASDVALNLHQFTKFVCLSASLGVHIITRARIIIASVDLNRSYNPASSSLDCTRENGWRAHSCVIANEHAAAIIKTTSQLARTCDNQPVGRVCSGGRQAAPRGQGSAPTDRRMRVRPNRAADYVLIEGLATRQLLGSARLGSARMVARSARGAQKTIIIISGRREAKAVQ